MEKMDLQRLVQGQLVTVRFVGECTFVADLDGVQAIVEHPDDGARFMVPADWIEDVEDVEDVEGYVRPVDVLPGDESTVSLDALFNTPQVSSKA